MDAFIVALPVFGKDQSVPLYEFVCETGRSALYIGSPSAGLDSSLGSLSIDILNEFGFDPFSNGQPMFAPFDQFSILFPLTNEVRFAAKDMIIMISKSLPATQSYVEIIWNLKVQGFKLAFDNYVADPAYDAFIASMDYVMIDVGNPRYEMLLAHVKSHYPNLKCVAKNVPTRDLFGKLRYTAFDYFHGPFFKQPIERKHTHIAPLKINAIQLLNIVNNEDFAPEEVARIVSQDTALSVALLKLLNSPAIGVRQRISSIKHGVVILGQKEFRKWVTTTVTREMAADKPNELIRLSLVRAKFAENLAAVMGLSQQSANLFLTGLFSVIDIILDTTMDAALGMLNLAMPTKNALLGRRGPYSPVMDVLHAYERADWTTVVRYISTYNLTNDVVLECFLEALRWYKQLLS